jgi:hypothetical protein
VQFVAAEMYRQGERSSPHLHYKMVHASRGKQTRAEPVSAEFEHGRCHHVGTFPQLEAEQTGWVPGMPSPSRMDAEVWCYTELLLGTHVPRDVQLGAVADLTQAAFVDRVRQGAPRHIHQPGPRREDEANTMETVRRRWSVDVDDNL